jgi:hypothetical protein
MRKTALVVALTLSLSTVAPGRALAQNPVRDSVAASGSVALALSVGAASIPVLAVAGAGSLAVASIAVVGSAVEVVLVASATGARALVTISAESMRQLGLAVGQIVDVMTMETGYLLSTSGRLICYVPNAMGEGLVRSVRVTR